MVASAVKLAVVVAALGACFAAPAAAQNTDDFKGVWSLQGPLTFDPQSVPPPAGTNARPPYNAEWQKKYLENVAKVPLDRFPDPISTCGTPAGFPRVLSLPDGIEFVVTRDQTWILNENGPNVTRIYTDGRKHPAAEDMWPTYTGDSVGSWKDGVLTFETIGVKGEPGGMILDRSGSILSDKAVMTTQLRKLDRDTVEARISIVDPVAFTRPYNVVKTYKRLPGDVRILDYACAENNRNPVAENGRTLTLDTSGNVIDLKRD